MFDIVILYCKSHAYDGPNGSLFISILLLNSEFSVLLDIETSIDLAIDTGINDIIITGDLNVDYLKENTRKKLLIYAISTP